MKIPIKKAKEIRESLNAKCLVIFTLDENGGQNVATHGKSRTDALQAATLGNELKTLLQWPENLCKSKPLERICKNCVYYKPDYGTYCFNGWTGDGSNGFCQLEPIRAPVRAEETCKFFEPNC